MEAVRLFLLKIILSAIILNVVLATPMNYNTISTSNRQTNSMPQAVNHARPYRRNWSSKSSSSDINKNMPPYLVFNRKVGAYYPYYKFPYENSLRRIQERLQGA